MTLKRILFFGTPDIAVSTLESLVQTDDVEILAVCVFPDRKVGRRQVLMPCPVKKRAEELELPIETIETKDDLIRVVQKYDFDFGIVIAFGMIFPGEILESGKFINVHFSLLPKYRGASPVQSAILNGDKVSGVTFQKMEAKLDAGDILFQTAYSIEGKTTSTVFEELSHHTAQLFPEFLKGTPPSKSQDESAATFCTKFVKTDGEIFPEKETAQQIYQKFLAFDFFPGIYLATERKGNVKLTDIRLKTDDGAFEIPCANYSTLFILEAQIPGKKPMDVQDILRGTPGLFSGYVS